MEKEYNKNEKLKLYPFISLQYLIELSHESSEQIILKLIKNPNKFQRFLEYKLESDWIVLTIAILSKMCTSCFEYNKAAVLKVVAKAKLLPKVEECLQIIKRTGRLNKKSNIRFWENPQEFLDNLLVVCDFYIKIISNRNCDTFPKLLETIDTIVHYLEEQQSVDVSLEIKSKIKILNTNLNMSSVVQSCDSQLYNFRTFNVCPTSEELLSSSCEQISNYVVRGKYHNVEHFLDVQFRLWRESCFGHVRQLIAKCIQYTKGNNPHTKPSGFTIYTDVFIKSYGIAQNRLALIIEFSDDKINEDIFSQGALCFKPKSLVCFTKDNFSTIILGHIIRKLTDSKKLMIAFKIGHMDYDYNVSYTMVGLQLHFNFIDYGLKILQGLSEVDFPLRSFLIDAIPSVEQPGYLDTNSSIYTIQGRSVDLFGNNWPSAEQLRLDSFQYTAFKAALTQKINVIQGAPGTGKTFLGLQIIKTLLHDDNKKYWYTNNAPILIITLLSSSLDELLESLLFTTEKIVQIVYTASSTQKLKNFNIQTVRKRIKSHRSESVQICQRQCDELLKQIKNNMGFLLLIKDFNIIINFTHFSFIDENVRTSWFSSASSDELLAWLFDREEIKNTSPLSVEISEIMDYIKDKQTNVTQPDENVLISNSRLLIEMVEISKKLQTMETDSSKKDNLKDLETELIELWETYQYFKMRMNNQTFSENPIKPANIDYDSPHNMDANDRWNLYFYWLNSYINYEEQRLDKLKHEYGEIYQNCGEIKRILDLEIFKDTLVLGVTIHAVSNWSATLQYLKCPIIVVEEVSEVLESQLLVCLTKHCKHLILMGNHQKLYSNKITENLCNYDVSMMDRIVRNKIPCQILGVQHRMDTKISKLLVPHIFPELKSDHPVVGNFPRILGVPSCIFFVHHQNVENEQHDVKSFWYETNFFINLARYLIQAGHKPEDITIITDDSDQIAVLREVIEVYKDLLKGVKMCDLDNYKGEKCKIMLLFLVRKQHKEKIDVLRYENSVVYVLSQAQDALYMMGDIDLLCENSEVWRNTKKFLKNQNCLGNYFPVSCEVNPLYVTHVKKPEDFDQIVNGVCSVICGSTLNCGHHCLKSCHIVDGDYSTVTGFEVCLTKSFNA